MDQIIKVHGTFIDLLCELEKVNINFVHLSGLYNFIFSNPDNQLEYIIHNIINSNETYIFQYYQNQNDKVLGNIPNGIFYPNDFCAFELNLTKKTFKKLNQFVIIDLNQWDDELKEKEKIDNQKKKWKLCTII